MLTLVLGYYLVNMSCAFSLRHILKGGKGTAFLKIFKPCNGTFSRNATPTRRHTRRGWTEILALAPNLLAAYLDIAKKRYWRYKRNLTRVGFEPTRIAP
ncbi:hypothetical protein F5B18DRAFT_598950 [Nemania serpens]|nr:hypothetical protein F5B18DRAFT_598950 [Nemania serpens]